ncbi:MAG: glycosyltransferase [Pyrinomonadaceae bacterium]
MKQIDNRFSFPLDEQIRKSTRLPLDNFESDPFPEELETDDELSGSLEQLAVSEEQLSEPTEDVSAMRARLEESEARLGEMGVMLSEMHSQLKNKNEILQWIVKSRSWRLTGWLRRLNFLSLRIRPGLRHLKRVAFRGALEQPGEGVRVTRNLEIKGWAYSTAAPIIHVEAFLDTISIGTLRHRCPRLDVASYTSQASVNCGYEGTLLVDPAFQGRQELTVRVVDRRGNVKDYTRTIEIVEREDLSSFNTAIILPRENGSVKTSSDVSFDSYLRDSLSTGKRLLTSISKISLESFLISDSFIKFPQHERPSASIILVLYNRAELTLQCLYSIFKSNVSSYEVVIIDNASTDETKALLKRVKGARIIENPTNVHYLKACNQAAKLARGRYLLLLNNDAQLQGDGISAAIETLNSSEDIGAVGGKVILPDGTLQEAGSIIWQDGSCLGYGRGDSPFAPAYMFKRDVDYCSAVFLLTRRDLFLQTGGFDEDYAPAYYEETDYCVRLWKQGKRVVYDPNISVLHYEFASSASHQNAIELQTQHRNIFVAKHREWLRGQQEYSSTNILSARQHRNPCSKRILYLDDRVPHLNSGSGFTRSNHVIRELVRMNHCVTCYPLSFPHEDWASVYQDIPREVEVVLDRGRRDLQRFIMERIGYYDIIYISRPHNVEVFNSLLEQHPRLFAGVKIIYDAEALFSLREIERLRLKGKRPCVEEQERLINGEMKLMENCHSIISVSERERQEFINHGFKQVHTLGHTLCARPTPNRFEERKDILFIGAIHDYNTPNADSVVWFSKKVLPLILKKLGPDVNFLIAGHDTSEFFFELNKGQIKVLGKVDDLTDLYNHARLFVAPTRFCAGIPHKAHEAAAHGLPLVATTLIGAQLGWNDEEELLLADDAESFAASCVRLYGDERLWNHLRQNALKRIETDCSPAAFAQRLKEIVG